MSSWSGKMMMFLPLWMLKVEGVRWRPSRFHGPLPVFHPPSRQVSSVHREGRAVLPSSPQTLQGTSRSVDHWNGYDYRFAWLGLVHTTVMIMSLMYHSLTCCMNLELLLPSPWWSYSSLMKIIFQSSASWLTPNFHSFSRLLWTPDLASLHKLFIAIPGVSHAHLP